MLIFTWSVYINAKYKIITAMSRVYVTKLEPYSVHSKNLVTAST